MNLAGKIVLGVVAFLLLLGITTCSTFVGTNNNCVKFEKGIQAQYDQNKNNYDNYFKELQEAVQVPDMYVNDMKKFYGSIMTGRYGSKGSQAMFQWLKEANIKFDSSLYTKIQQIISAGRKTFEMNQTMLIDKKREYDTYISKFPTSLIAGILGFLKIDMDKFNIITSVETEKAFETGKSAPLKLR